jgi:hypothetical protein
VLDGTGKKQTTQGSTTLTNYIEFVASKPLFVGLCTTDIAPEGCQKTWSSEKSTMPALEQIRHPALPVSSLDLSTELT